MTPLVPDLTLAAAERGAGAATRDGPVEQRTCGNMLLERMPASDFALIGRHLERVPLPLGSSLAGAGEPIETICFLEGGVAGFLDVLENGRRLTVGLVGKEGFIGWPALMGDDRWPYDVEIRAEDATALRLDVRHLLSAVGSSPGLRDFLLRFAGAFTAQMGRTIVSNLIHSVERRAARWILLYHDRVRGDEIAMTHEELSLMLGVRRASVTEALHGLEGEHAIRGVRGRIIVRDRAALEALAGETYGFAEAEHRRLVARPLEDR